MTDWKKAMEEQNRDLSTKEFMKKLAFPFVFILPIFFLLLLFTYLLPNFYNSQTAFILVVMYVFLIVFYVYWKSKKHNSQKKSK